ncbi:MAG TPA: GrpB family protein, partial [Opitutaceae bacterium]|nr:GrpB family protein [Opitutaceae bacterium]
HRASDEVRRFRTFKERLMQHPELVTQYCACKRQIVTERVMDTDDYAVRKRPFIHKALGHDYPLKETKP